MRVSAKVDYATRALAELAARAESGPVKGETIATAQGIPVRFLENILADLRTAGIVASRRGSEGGYWLARPAEAVSLGAVIRAVEGPLGAVQGSAPEAVTFPGPAASLREVWVAARSGLRAVLDEVTLADVVTGDLPGPLRDRLAQPDAWTRRRPG